ncbi:MAG: YlmC/YmxH family sporulation protein [Clostridia bacterium]|nr:YlmC/YmxH family sporulation protein [Clostridia bacterium]
MEYTLTELKKKTVINLSNGKKLGKITDVTLNVNKNSIVSYLVSPSKINLFCNEDSIIKPCQIEKIGEDAILVRTNVITINCECGTENSEEGE